MWIPKRSSDSWASKKHRIIVALLLSSKKLLAQDKGWSQKLRFSASIDPAKLPREVVKKAFLFRRLNFWQKFSERTRMGRKPTFIVLVRHGERLDEVDRYAWQQMRTHDNQYDPPLTKTGRVEGWPRETFWMLFDCFKVSSKHFFGFAIWDSPHSFLNW